MDLNVLLTSVDGLALMSRSPIRDAVAKVQIALEAPSKEVENLSSNSVGAKNHDLDNIALRLLLKEIEPHLPVDR